MVMAAGAMEVAVVEAAAVESKTAGDHSFDPDILAERILNASPVLFAKITAALDCSDSEVGVALREVIRFLYLVANNDSGMLTPSHRVDLVWHEFILCTRAYERFCSEQFGRFIHHTPGGESEQNRQQYRKTLKSYRAVFGEPDPSYWPTGSSTPQPDCGPCEAV